MSFAMNAHKMQIYFEAYQRKGEEWVRDNMRMPGQYFRCGICGKERVMVERSEHFGDICKQCIRLGERDGKEHIY